MTTTPPPWEPPIAGTEAEHLVGALDRMRWTFRWKVDGLDAAGLSTTIGASSLTLGGLLKHLALVEDFHRITKIGGGDMTQDADSPYQASTTAPSSAIAPTWRRGSPIRAWTSSSPSRTTRATTPRCAA
jgi:hypothetical protein